MRLFLKHLAVVFICINLTFCNNESRQDSIEEPDDTNIDVANSQDTFGSLPTVIKPVLISIDSAVVIPENLIAFAKSLIGVPYKYASTDPAQGFDCSGFITHVFNHFNVKVPRSSVDFTNVGLQIPMREARKGDLVLFTGTDSSIRVVGHMGIITENTDSLRFIHSTSGRQYGVTITALGNYYNGRFVKVIRVF